MKKRKMKTNAASASSGSGSARSWNLLGQSDGSTATGSLGSHGWGSSDDNRNTRRRLDTFSSQRMNMHEVPFCFMFHVNNITLECLLGSKNSGQQPMHLSANLPEIHCKTGVPCQPDSYSKRAECQDFVARHKDDVIPYAVDIVHFDEMLKTISLSLHLTPVHKSSAFWIAGTEWRNQFSNLHHPDANIRLILLLLTCVFLVFLMKYCDRSFVKPSGSESCGLCVMAAPSPPRRSAAWRVEAPHFAVSLCCGPCNLLSIWFDA